MSEKRYFERKWEGEYYIFDSYTISEKDFDEKVEYEDYQAFADSMTGEEVTDRLNKYNKEYLDCHNDVLRLEKENEQLQKQLSDVRKENYGNLDGINYYQEQNASLSERISDLECENEQLKQSNKDAWNLIQFIYNEIKEDGYMDWGRIQDLVEF